MISLIAAFSVFLFNLRSTSAALSSSTTGLSNVNAPDWVQLVAGGISMDNQVMITSGMIEAYEEFVASHPDWEASFTSQQTDLFLGSGVSSSFTGSSSHNVSEPLWFEQRLSHFNDGGVGDVSWKQRFWYSDYYYKPGGPVLLFDCGEGEGGSSWVDPRYDYLTTTLMKELGALGISLEHRYYGQSQPTSDLSTDNLRWLNVRESVADNAWLALNIVLPDFEGDIRAPATPWIIVGGSYPGAKSAILKVTYPSVFFGNVALAPVVGARISMWQYWDLIRQKLPEQCSSLLVAFTDAVDAVLGALDNESLRLELFRTFGVSNSLTNTDFAFALSAPVRTWQSASGKGKSNGDWDPKNGKYGEAIDSLCGVLAASVTNEPSTPFEPHNDLDAFVLQALTAFQASDLRTTDMSPFALFRIFNAYRGFFNDKASSFGAGDNSNLLKNDYSSFAERVSLDQWSSRSWPWQYCSEFGFFFTTPPQNQPSIISRAINQEYWQSRCNQQFSPGQNFSLPSQPDIEKITQFGDQSLDGPRLIISNGEYDAWTPVSAFSSGRPGGQGFTIPYAAHAFDLYGPNNPNTSEPVRETQQAIIAEVKSWFGTELVNFLASIKLEWGNNDKDDPTLVLEKVYIAATSEEQLMFSEAHVKKGQSATTDSSTFKGAKVASSGKTVSAVEQEENMDYWKGRADVARAALIIVSSIAGVTFVLLLVILFLYCWQPRQRHNVTPGSFLYHKVDSLRPRVDSGMRDLEHLTDMKGRF